MADFIGELCDRDQYDFGMLNPNMEKLLKRLGQCGSWMDLRYYLEHGQSRITNANFCGKHLLCQSCAIRRGAKSVQKLLPKIEAQLAANPKLKAYMLTLTVVDGPDLHERFHHLQDAIKRLNARKRAYNKNPKKGWTEFQRIKGSAYSTEIKRGKNSGWWHPHSHMLILCEEPPELGWVDPETGEGFGLRKEWFDVTGDSYVMDCREAYGGNKLLDACCEVMKYATKFTAQAPEDTWHLFQELNGKRLMGTWGNLYGFKLPESLTDEALSGPYIEYCLRYFGGGQYQVKEVRDHSETYEQPSRTPEGALQHASSGVSDSAEPMGQNCPTIFETEEIICDEHSDSTGEDDELPRVREASAGVDAVGGVAGDHASDDRNGGDGPPWPCVPV